MPGTFCVVPPSGILDRVKRAPRIVRQGNVSLGQLPKPPNWVCEVGNLGSSNRREAGEQDEGNATATISAMRSGNSNLRLSTETTGLSAKAKRDRERRGHQYTCPQIEQCGNNCERCDAFERRGATAKNTVHVPIGARGIIGYSSADFATSHQEGIGRLA